MLKFLKRLVFYNDEIGKGDSVQKGKKFEEALPIKDNIRILCIADTHGALTTANVELLRQTKYDVCLLLGDICYADMFKLIGVLDKSKTYGIVGNHDSLNLLDDFGIRNIHMDRIETSNLSFLGFQGSHRYKNGDYPMYTQEEALEHTKNLPYADVFVTHDAPFEVYSTHDSHCGFRAFTEYLTDRKVPLHLHGHIHRNHATLLPNGTVSICVYGGAIIETRPINVQVLFDI